MVYKDSLILNRTENTKIDGKWFIFSAVVPLHKTSQHKLELIWQFLVQSLVCDRYHVYLKKELIRNLLWWSTIV